MYDRLDIADLKESAFLTNSTMNDLVRRQLINMHPDDAQSTLDEWTTSLLWYVIHSFHVVSVWTHRVHPPPPMSVY